MILVILALSCPAPVLQNVSGYPWNSYDKKEQRYAEKRCKQIYDDAPCLKLWRKFGKQDYSAICGAEK